jgi:predicted anti-sigma-YlaC factor YlaD
MNTNCEFIQNNLFAIQENGFSEAGMALVKEHLAGCKSCEAMLQSFTSFTDLIETEKKEDFTPFLGTRILQKMELQTAAAGYSGMLQFPRALRPLMAAALIILAVLTGFLAGKQGRSITRQTAGPDLNAMKSDLFITELNDEDKTIELYK